MFKIFFDNRVFIISDNLEESLAQNAGIITKVNSKNEMSELVAYFETAHQTHSLWVYVPDAKEGFAWVTSCFILIEAAGGLVQNKNDEYLLIYRFEHWDLPKGKMEKNETPEETALREVEEECSLSNLNLYSHIVDTYHTYRIKNKLYLKRTYWYNMRYNGNATPLPQTEEAIEKAEWVSADMLNNHVDGMYTSIVDVFKVEGLVS